MPFSAPASRGTLGSPFTHPWRSIIFPGTCQFLHHQALPTFHAPKNSSWLRILLKLTISVNPAADALRAAMLAVGAVHLRFTHDSSDQKGAWAIVRASKAKVLSLVRRSIDSQQATNTPMDKGDVEMILAALLSCTIASVRTAHVYRFLLVGE